MYSLNDRTERIECLRVAREQVRKAVQSVQSDRTASNHETALGFAAEASLRDWQLALEREASGPLSEERGLSTMYEQVVRFGAKLDKIEALFEKLVEQQAARVASRDRFEQSVLARLGPIQHAVRFLLARDDSETAKQHLQAVWTAETPKASTEIR